MGDVMTLIEKAETVIDENAAKKMAEKLEANKFDMDDLLEQMRQIKKLGNIKSIVGMLPFADKIPESEMDEKRFTRTEAIIQSMTAKERRKPAIITPSRKRRIAKGSGTEVHDVNTLLKQFESMQKMFKQMNKGGLFGGKMGKMLNKKALRGLNLDDFGL
jgi:signal recognition particle subunit SRP54